MNSPRLHGAGRSAALERLRALEVSTSTEPDDSPPRKRDPRPRTRRDCRARRRAKRSARKTVVGRHPYRSVAVVVLLGLTPVWTSLGEALNDPGFGSSIPARFAEWAREHGAGPVAVWAENLWYSHHQPPIGGSPAKGAIPSPSKASSRTTSSSAHRVAHLPDPAPLKPFASPPIPGEGAWHPAGREVDGLSAIYETYLRPDAIHTSVVVGVAWMDTKLLKATLYSGSTIPGGGPYPNTAPVEPAAAKTLVAAFNAGFLMNNANGGYYTDGKVIVPLRSGAASFVIYRNGTATVAKWGRDATLTSNVVAVRQNLNLLVDEGKPVPGLNANDTTQWGYTLGNQIYVWRSGVGVTRDGALVYVGGPGLNITSLADLLVRAGTVRAMELDINTDWVNFATFKPGSPSGLATATSGTDLLSDMAFSPGHYFASWWTRDFFTMSARSAAG